MTKKINQARPEGISQPEIRPGDKWQDKTGRLVSVTGYVFNRVTYVRDGYEHPCQMTDYRFTREFAYLPDESANHQKAAVENGLSKVQEIKNKLKAAKQ